MGSLNDFYGSIGVIFHPNMDGDVLDMQADIIGPGMYLLKLREICLLIDFEIDT